MKNDKKSDEKYIKEILDKATKEYIGDSENSDGESTLSDEEFDALEKYYMKIKSNKHGKKILDKSHHKNYIDATKPVYFKQKNDKPFLVPYHGKFISPDDSGDSDAFNLYDSYDPVISSDRPLTEKEYRKKYRECIKKYSEGDIELTEEELYILKSFKDDFNGHSCVVSDNVSDDDFNNQPNNID